jgi:hypothetical protein
VPPRGSVQPGLTCSDTLSENPICR